MVLWLVALAVRQGPLIVAGRWAGEFTWDEGVYFAASQQWVHGQWPYADFLMVHPPGIVLFLAPFAALADVVPDGVAAGLARTAMSALGATSAVLVALLLRPYGRAAAIAGSVLYAVWSATVWAEWAILLEPLLAVGLLAALLLLAKDSPPASERPGGPAIGHTIAAGCLMGVILTVKLWAAVPLVVLGAMLLVRDPNRAGLGRLLGFGAAATGTAALVVLPFVGVAGPAAIWRDVVAFQFGRPAGEVPRGRRLGYFDGSLLAPERLPDAIWLILGLVAAVVAAGAVAVLARGRAVPLRQWPPTGWLAVALAQVLALLAAPSFYPTYTLAAAPTLCLIAGICVQVVADRLPAKAGHRGSRRTIVALGAALALVLAVMSTGQVARDLTPARDWGALDRIRPAAVDGAAGCVWAPTPRVLIEADLAADQARADCPLTIDVYATVQRESGVPDQEFEAVAAHARDYQAQVAGQLATATLVIVDDAGWARLDPANQERIRQGFAVAGATSGYTIWRSTSKR